MYVSLTALFVFQLLGGVFSLPWIVGGDELGGLIHPQGETPPPHLLIGKQRCSVKIPEELQHDARILYEGWEAPEEEISTAEQKISEWYATLPKDPDALCELPDATPVLSKLLLLQCHVQYLMVPDQLQDSM